MQVLCGLQGIFLLFNCQTPVPDDMEVELEPSVYTRPEHAEEYRFYEQLNGN